MQITAEHKVILSLGSNLGNRLDMLRKAISRLESEGLQIEAKSRVWETTPWGVEDQPFFLNMCICARTPLSPMMLLCLLKKTEAELGRSPGKRWGPREIDIDIIFFDSIVFEDSKLRIPHPYMHQRAFVLKPLAEIAPELMHPVLEHSVAELLELLPDDGANDMTWITEI